MQRPTTSRFIFRPRSFGLALSVALGFWMSMMAPAHADTWAIDKQHTNVGFSWNHLGVSRQSGRVLDVEGLLEFDPAAPEASSLEVVMRVASIWTGVEALDKLLASSDFFGASRHPAITFRSTAIKRISDKTGEVTGDLTIMGATNPVILQVTWNFSGEHPMAPVNANFKDKHVSGFSAQTRILRSAWGVTRGIPLASDEIDITIETELIRR
jgi:polyisoprenoid-binding protein YceI